MKQPMKYTILTTKFSKPQHSRILKEKSLPFNYKNTHGQLQIFKRNHLNDKNATSKLTH